MVKASPLIKHELNGIVVEQRSIDGYLNATKLAKAYELGTGIRKDVRDWLLTERAKSYIERLSAKTGIPVLDLVQVKKGGNAPGTWLHPKLATPFGTDDKKYCGKFFAQVHDAINISITGETAREMKARFSQTLGRPVKDSELIRDYFPPLHLQKYIAVCEAVANFIIREGLHPLIAVERAAEIVLPANYLPEPVEAVENIKFVRQRLHQPLIGASNSNFLGNS